MKINKLTVLILLLLFSFALFTLLSCGKAEEAIYPGKDKSEGLALESAPAEEPSIAPPSPDDTTRPSVTDVSDTNTIKRKIIKRAQISIKVKSFLETFDSLQGMVESEGGFIADSSSYKSDLGNMSGEISIRIPPENFESLIKKIETLGDVESKSISGEDITKKYYDLELRLKTKEEMQKRLLLLLAKQTNNVKDLLEVERELGRVRGEIESIKGSLRYYDNLLGMSTITLNLAEPAPIGPSKSVWAPLKSSIRDSFEAFSYSVRALMIFIFAVLPWLLLASIFIIALWKIVKKLKKDKGKASKK